PGSVFHGTDRHYLAQAQGARGIRQHSRTRRRHLRRRSRLARLLPSARVAPDRPPASAAARGAARPARLARRPPIAVYPPTCGMYPAADTATRRGVLRPRPAPTTAAGCTGARPPMTARIAES